MASPETAPCPNRWDYGREDANRLTLVLKLFCYFDPAKADEYDRTFTVWITRYLPTKPAIWTATTPEHQTKATPIPERNGMAFGPLMASSLPVLGGNEKMGRLKAVSTC
jgi:hypothetical protein